METPAEKGYNLENAIEKVETAILRADPSLKDGVFKIETRKILSVSGVRHEVDVYVSIDHSKGYNSLFIFEAKNWKAKVGKNEIIVFQEKINALSAQRGFFVGKEFTKDAENQAALDPRTELVVATDDFEVEPLFPDLHVVARQKPGSATMSLMEKIGMSTEEAKTKIQIDMEADTVVVNGEGKSMKEFSNYVYENAVEDKLRTEPTQTYAQGEYILKHKKMLDFSSNPLVCKERKFEAVEIEVEFLVYVYRPKIVSRFDIASRGRVVAYETVDMGNEQKLDLSFIAHQA